METYCPKCLQQYPESALRCSHDDTPLVKRNEDDLTGRTLDNRYLVKRRIGKGGMGDVYLAEQKLLGREVAMKVLRRELAQDEKALKRLMIEARVIAGLNSRYTVTLFDVGTVEDGRLYYTMELVRGRSLADLILKEAPLDLVRSSRLVCQVCDSLEEAHGKGVLHRDLKPDNLHVVADRGRELVKVLDFGIAKIMGDTGDPLTAMGIVIGTPLYVSPEQASGTALGPASDLYSLAVVLFEMITGLPPFRGESPMKTVWAHVKDPVPALSQRNPHVYVPDGLEQFMQRALHKTPAMRFPDAASFRTALCQIVGQGAAPSYLVPLGHEPEAVAVARASNEAFREQAREHIRVQTLGDAHGIPHLAQQRGGTVSLEANIVPPSPPPQPPAEPPAEPLAEPPAAALDAPNSLPSPELSAAGTPTLPPQPAPQDPMPLPEFLTDCGFSNTQSLLRLDRAALDQPPPEAVNATGEETLELLHSHRRAQRRFLVVTAVSVAATAAVLLWLYLR